MAESLNMDEVNLVWFKRDLRLRDHAPLYNAINADKPLILAYVIEPSLVNDPHYDDRHWCFVWQSLLDLNEQLKHHNAKITIVYAEAIEAFRWLNQTFNLATVFSYEEVGLNKTFQRDRTIQHFLSECDANWVEYPNAGVQRGLTHRMTWKKAWRHYLSEPTEDPALEHLHTVDVSLSTQTMEVDGVPVYAFDNQSSVRAFLKRCGTTNARFQVGGEKRAWFTLKHFFAERGQSYAKHISKPDLARTSCSRLSPYLAWGNISSRQVIRYLNQLPKRSEWRRTYTAFKSRIQWRSHFIQKFESESRMEFEAVNHAYCGYPYRTDDKVDHDLLAWQTGNTGIPLIDACMRALRATGYLNFRMRAMLVSFLTHHLNINWQQGVTYLGSLFLDFEPGIHYPQFQMQAGITGTNTIRLYNPVKQSTDHDPDGAFIKKWIPALQKVPKELIHTPWEMTDLEQSLYDLVLGKDYPLPIVDLTESARHARDRLWSYRERDDVKAEAKRILYRHSLPDSPRT